MNTVRYTFLVNSIFNVIGRIYNKASAKTQDRNELRRSGLIINNHKMVVRNYINRGYFRSVWTTVYQFWAYLIWVPKLGKPRKKFAKVNIDILCK